MLTLQAEMLIGFRAESADAKPFDSLLYGTSLIVGGATLIPKVLRAVPRRQMASARPWSSPRWRGHAGPADGDRDPRRPFLHPRGLERDALARPTHDLRALLDLVPATATIRRHGSDVSVPATAPVAGDWMIVRPGDRIATDGSIIFGLSSLDVSSITGESMPIGAAPGDTVPAGDVNDSGAAEIDVSAAWPTTLSIASCRSCRRPESVASEPGHLCPGPGGRDRANARHWLTLRGHQTTPLPRTTIEGRQGAAQTP